MRVVVNGSTHGLSDAQAFIERLAEESARGVAAPPTFVAGRDIVVTRAPTRLSLFGGLVNGTGARVLHWPLGGGALVALQRQSERTLRISRAGAGGIAASLELPLHYLENDGRIVDPAVARDYFARYEDRRWAVRPAGAVLTLMRERAVRFREGLSLLIEPAAPEDDGLGAQAALEVATLRALAAAANVSLDAQDLVRLCRVVEQTIAAAPFPWSDCVAAARAPAGMLLATTAAPAATPDVVVWPAGLVWCGLSLGPPVLRSDIRRARLQTAALMAYRIAADIAALRVRARGPRQVTVEDALWRGRLAAIPRGEFARTILPGLPEALTAEEFYARYRGLAGGAPAPEGSVPYPVRAAAQHVIAEQDRARQFEYLLDPAHGEPRLSDLGGLLAESLSSHVDLGLIDGAVRNALRGLGETFRASGGVGISVVAGGEGRTLAVLARTDSVSSIHELAGGLERALRVPVTIVGGTSPGAYRFGSIRLRGR